MLVDWGGEFKLKRWFLETPLQLDATWSSNMPSGQIKLIESLNRPASVE